MGWPRFLAACAAVLAGPASAGDYADRHILGFSPDGTYFAFEEYGVQDGSGFPYSNIYVIDATKDSWIAGTPVRVRIDNEDASLAQARSDALGKSRSILDKLQIADRGITAASNPATELSADPYSVRFRTNPYFNMAERAWTLKLTPLPFPEAPPCENLGPVAGFRLDLTDPDGAVTAMNEDRSVPASRACPQDYAISDVLTLTPESGDGTMVVLLSLFRQGFEGPDRRFLAVATRFHDR